MLMKNKISKYIFILGSILIIFKIVAASLAYVDEATNLNKAPLVPHLYPDDDFNKNYTEVKKPNAYRKLVGTKEKPENCIKTKTRLFCDFNKVGFGTIVIKSNYNEKNIEISLGERAKNNEVWFPNKNVIDIKNIEYYKTNSFIKSSESLVVEVHYFL